MIINNKRALAYVVTVDETREIPGYNRVEHARVGGWWIIVAKSDNINIGDKCVYFEVDSKVPESDNRFAFLEKRNYKVKTIKMCKVLSQGLLMPITLFPELGDNPEVFTDVTDTLGIKYAVDEDNERKAEKVNKDKKYQSMAARHAKLFKKPVFHWLMRRDWGRKLLFVFFGKKKDNPRGWPTHLIGLQKSDQERVQNMTWVLNDKVPYIETVKIDGTSGTFALERKKNGKYEFYVCSRNVRQADREQENYHANDENVYWQAADKYKIEEFLKQYLTQHNLPWVALQGEIAGCSLKGKAIQGDPHKFGELRFFAYDIYEPNTGKIDIIKAKDACKEHGIPWVPITNLNFVMPDTVDELLLHADGPCEADGASGLREGYVYRKKDNTAFSFKAVSNKYLLKH